MTTAHVVRAAEPRDIPAIASIFNHEILTGTSSWQADPRTATEMEAWAEACVSDGYPLLVAELPSGDIAGYASYGPFRTFPGYRFTVEHSLYVAASARRKGIASALIEALVAAATEAGMHAMIGGVSADQPASIAFHARHGFREVGRLPQVGAKFGRWLDLVLMQRLLDENAAPQEKSPN